MQLLLSSATGHSRVLQSMAPKRTSAKAKATARAKSLVSSNLKRAQRRKAVKVFNDLADELSLGGDRLYPKEVDKSQLETQLRLLNRRCTANPLHARFDQAVRQFVDNAGTLPEGVTLANSQGTPAATLLFDDDGQALPGSAEQTMVPRHKVLKAGFRLRSKAFMLTHNSRSFTRATWNAYRNWTQALAVRYGATAWAACLEESENASGGGVVTVYHVHSYLLWEDGVGIQLQDLTPLKFQEVKPRVDKCIQVANGKCPRTAALQGYYYVSVKKSGTVEVHATWQPWRDYTPLKTWLMSLYDSGKLTHQAFKKLSAQFRSGHAKRKHDALEIERDELELAVDEHVNQEREALLEENPLQNFRTFDIVTDYVASFQHRLWRRPVLVIVGGTNLGKSQLARDVLTKVARVLGLSSFEEVTVEGDTALDFSSFDLRRDAGVLLDGVNDALTLKSNREVLQGVPKKCRGGRSNTMMYSYPYTLCRRAVVATMDLSARNLELFSTDHWLSNPANCKVLQLTAPVWERPGSPAQPLSKTEQLGLWTCQELRDYLSAHDLVGLAAHLYGQSVNGADFLHLREAQFVDELRCTPFAARKLLAARTAFLD